jgi:hypothetical protein
MFLLCRKARKGSARARLTWGNINRGFGDRVNRLGERVIDMGQYQS